MYNQLDYNNIKTFWQARANREIPVENIGNLEDDPDLSQIKVDLEKEKILNFVTLTPDMLALDLGAGTCFWSIILAKKVRKVVAVDFTKSMLERGMQDAAKAGILNIDFIHESSEAFLSDSKFHFIFISGLFLYLNDIELKKVMSNISQYSQKGTEVFLRDGTGIGERYEFTDRYSAKLQAYYSATYRTRQEFIGLFNSEGFTLIKDEDMFETDFVLNAYSETKLRIYLFKKL